MAILNGKSGRFDIKTENSAISGYVAWQETYDDSTYVSTNKTKVTIEAYLHRTNIYNSPTSINANVTRKAYFGSDVVEDDGWVSLSIAGNNSSSGGAYTKVYSASKEITHNNNGSKTLDLGFYMNNALSGTGANAFKVPKTLSNVSLMTVPRYATCTQKLISKTETSAKIDWSTDYPVDYLWYSTNDGYSWVEVGVADGKSGSYSIGNLSADTLYNVKTKVRRKDNQLISESSRLQVTTYDYPHCTEAPHFTIGQELTLTFYNPLNRSITVQFIDRDDNVLSTDITTETKLEGYNTSRFVEKLYNSIPNSTAGYYKVGVIYDEVTKITDKNSSYNINGDICNPFFTDFTYKDSNTTVSQVTGNNQVLVKGFSNLQVVISTANKMVARCGASPYRYNAVIEGINIPELYSENEIILNVGSITSAGTKRLSVIAYDSRYSRREVSKDIVIYDYTKPEINLEVSRLNNFEDQTTIKVNGSYDKLTIDNVDKNSVQSVEYRYREKGNSSSEWSTWASAKATLSNGKFTCNDVIVSLDKTKAFEIEVRVTDKLDSNSVSASIDVGEAIFFISSNKKACYINGEKILMYEKVNETLNSVKLEDNTLMDSTGVLHGDKPLSDFLTSEFNKVKTITNGISTDINRTDLNSYTSGFVAGYGHNLINSPLETQNQGHLISVPRNDTVGFVTQYFSPYPSNDVYIRKCENGTWGKWHLITNDYSGNEQIIGTWIDGKPIYRKVINLGNLPNKTTKEVSTGLTHTNIRIVRLYGNACNGTGAYQSALNDTSSRLNLVENNKLHITTTGDFSSYTGYAILEYTKTTD